MHSPVQIPRRRRAQAGFTLVELIVVMVIVGILASVVVLQVVKNTEKAKRTKALADIETLGAAVDSYAAENGDYPTTEQGLQALREKPASAPLPRNWNGPYIKRAVPTDSWGNAYVYVSPGEHSPDSFDLSSYAKDGAPGGQDWDEDITNWEDQTQ